MKESDGQSSHDPTVRLMINPQLSPFLALITMMISPTLRLADSLH